MQEEYTSLRPSIARLLEERNTVYADAWVEAGRMFASIADKDCAMFNHIYSHNWFLILSKLARLLANPTHLDSWRDIAGYAQLVINDLEEG